MPYIKVDTNKIRSYATEIDSARKVLNNTKQSLSDIRYALDWDVRYSSFPSIDRRIDRVTDELYSEANSLTNMRNYLTKTVSIYDKQVYKDHSTFDDISGTYKIVNAGYGALKKVYDYYNFVDDIVDAVKIKRTFKNGKVFLKGYKRGSGFTGRYNLDTWKNKCNTPSVLDKILTAVDVGFDAVNSGFRLHNVWNDENKSTEKKIYDTMGTVGGFAAATAVRVGGMALSKSIGTSVAIAAVPVLGPLAPVAGVVVGAVAGHAISSVADALTSEAVVNQASDSIENIVGAAKAGCQAISDKAKEVAEAKGLDKAAKAAELVGTAVVETAKVAVTTVVESVKTTATVVVESVKNFFKGW